MKRNTALARSCCALLLGTALGIPAGWARPPQRDHLTQTEADKIRDADTTNDRIRLFLDFAQDRLDRFQRELRMKGAGPRWADYLNDLLDAFDSCVEEAAGRVSDGLHNGEDVRAGIKQVEKRVPEFLKELEKIRAQGTDLKLYQDALDDAMDDLRDVIQRAEKADQELQRNPPKRKPHGALP